MPVACPLARLYLCVCVCMCEFLFMFSDVFLLYTGVLISGLYGYAFSLQPSVTFKCPLRLCIGRRSSERLRSVVVEQRFSAYVSLWILAQSKGPPGITSTVFLVVLGNVGFGGIFGRIGGFGCSYSPGL